MVSELCWNGVENNTILKGGLERSNTIGTVLKIFIQKCFSLKTLQFLIVVQEFILKVVKKKRVMNSNCQ